MNISKLYGKRVTSVECIAKAVDPAARRFKRAATAQWRKQKPFVVGANIYQGKVSA